MDSNDPQVATTLEGKNLRKIFSQGLASRRLANKNRGGLLWEAKDLRKIFSREKENGSELGQNYFLNGSELGQNYFLDGAGEIA